MHFFWRGDMPIFLLSSLFGGAERGARACWCMASLRPGVMVVRAGKPAPARGGHRGRARWPAGARPGSLSCPLAGRPAPHARVTVVSKFWSRPEYQSCIFRQLSSAQRNIGPQQSGKSGLPKSKMTEYRALRVKLSDILLSKLLFRRKITKDFSPH